MSRLKSAKRSIVAITALLLVVALVGGGLVQAQDTASHVIKIGDIVTGTLDIRNFTQVYSFTATAGSTISLVAASKTRGLTLAMVLTDASGAALARSADLTKTENAIRDFKIPADGTYYVTILRGTGAQGGATGEFALLLTGTSAAPPSSVATDGLSVGLT